MWGASFVLGLSDPTGGNNHNNNWWDFESWSGPNQYEGTTVQVQGNSRAYLRDFDGGDYVRFDLTDSVMRFSLDLSNVPCGVVAAVYLVAMGSRYWYAAKSHLPAADGGGWRPRIEENETLLCAVPPHLTTLTTRPCAHVTAVMSMEQKT